MFRLTSHQPAARTALLPPPFQLRIAASRTPFVTRSLTRPRLVPVCAILIAISANVITASALAVASEPAQAVQTAAPAHPGSVSLSGRVIELDSHKPVAGAKIVVTCSYMGASGQNKPSWVGDTTLHSDADGRFNITFTPDQVAEPALWVAISRVEHPDFIARKGFPVSLVNLLRGRQYGDKPFFHTITLERGLVYVGQVVTEDAKPAANVPFEFENWGWGSNRVPNLANDDSGKTDAEGRFRLRMAKTHGLAIRVIPGSASPFQQHWGTAEPAKHPDVFAPTDLGRLVLTRGPVLRGQLLDIAGQPMRGREITASGRLNRLIRAAITDANGRFAFGPLRPGNYDIYGAGQSIYGGVDWSKPPMPEGAVVLQPVSVYLEQGVAPAPLELREIPTVNVTVRFVDSVGRPSRRSGPVTLTGFIAGGNAAGDFDEMRLASALNDAEPKLKPGPARWGAQANPGTDGVVTFRVPKGLQNAHFDTFPADETTAYRTRLASDGALRFWGGGEIGNLNADRAGIEVVTYRAALVLATIVTEDGEPVPAGASASAGFNVKGGDFGGGDVKQANGRFRLNLIPDHEYELYAGSTDYIPVRVQRISLPEGATCDVTLTIRRRPTPLKVGDPAPPLSVDTLEGRHLRLVDFRGKYLLLHTWSPYHGGDRDVPSLRMIRTRFGADRLAMLGLCFAVDPDSARTSVRDQSVSWPQAVLRDRGNDPFIQNLGFSWPPKTYLIGPDGAIVARDLDADKIEKSVADALGQR
jgi:protocatechuate 3,4-dioxygenase beta subunit